MKLYLSTTAPGNEDSGECIGKVKVKRRLLSYFLIVSNQLEMHKLWKNMKKDFKPITKRRRKNENTNE